MPSYIALLRGINVGGSRKIQMAPLRALFERMGFTDVQTYLQSGNVVFSSGEEPSAKLICHAIRDEFGHDVPVILISGDAFRKVAKAKPLGDEDPASHHVIFLEKPPPAPIPQADLPISGKEAATLHLGHYYLYLPHGVARTKLSQTYFERRLHITATGRNWKTIQALAQMS